MSEKSAAAGPCDRKSNALIPILHALPGAPITYSCPCGVSELSTATGWRLSAWAIEVALRHYGHSERKEVARG